MLTLKKNLFAAALYSCIVSIVLSCGYKEDSQLRSKEQQDRLEKDYSAVEKQYPNCVNMIDHDLNSSADSLDYYEFYLIKGRYYRLKSMPEPLKDIALKTISFTNKMQPSKRLNDLRGQAFEELACYYYMFRGDADSTLLYRKKAYALIASGNELSHLPNICANMADAYKMKNNMAMAAWWYRRALLLTDSLNMDESVNVSIYLGLASVYTALEDYRSAQFYYNKTEREYQLLDPNMKVYFVNNYGNYYYYKQDYKNALKQFSRLKSLIAQGGGGENDMAVCKVNMADVFLNLGELDSAQLYLDGVEPYFKRIKSKVGVFYVNSIKLGLAVKRNHLAEAHEIIKSEKTGIDEPGINDIRNRYMMEYYLKTGKYREAFNLRNSISERTDSMEKSKAHVRAEQIMLEFQNDTLRLHNTIRLTEKQSEADGLRNTMNISIAVALIIILALLAVTLYARKKHVQNEYDMLQTRLANIRSRVSPHFIFNVLNHEIYDNKEETERLLLLSKLLRQGLNISYSTFVKLNEEIDFVKQYVAIEMKQHEDNFVFRLDVPSDDILKTRIIPSMFIQILVENVIKHAFTKDGKENVLQVKVDCQHEQTVINVIDNGNGFDLSQSSRGSVGTGLRVIQQTVQITNSRNRRKMHFEIHNKKDEQGNVSGCVATLIIPTNIKFS
jgi:tetratricopeptide (TPR) repeat protein